MWENPSLTLFCPSAPVSAFSQPRGSSPPFTSGELPVLLFHTGRVHRVRAPPLSVTLSGHHAVACVNSSSLFVADTPLFLLIPHAS